MMGCVFPKDLVDAMLRDEKDMPKCPLCQQPAQMVCYAWNGMTIIGCPCVPVDKPMILDLSGLKNVYVANTVPVKCVACGRADDDNGHCGWCK